MPPDLSPACPMALPAVLLAGGRGRRMGGGDKCLVELAGKPLLAHALTRIQPQAGPLLLSANGDPARFGRFGLPVAADPVDGLPGPLAGILAGMRWAATIGYRQILSLPTDTPFFPTDLAASLHAAATPARPVVCAASGGAVHPVVALWPTVLADRLEAELRAGRGKVAAFAKLAGLCTVEWPNTPFDPFFNVNTSDDLAAAEAVLASSKQGAVPCPPRPIS